MRKRTLHKVVKEGQRMHGEGKGKKKGKGEWEINKSETCSIKKEKKEAIECQNEKIFFSV